MLLFEFTANQRKRGNVHSHIVAVNEVYENARRQFPLKADSQKQADEAIDEEIVSSNKGTCFFFVLFWLPMFVDSVMDFDQLAKPKIGPSWSITLQLSS